MGICQKATIFHAKGSYMRILLRCLLILLLLPCSYWLAAQQQDTDKIYLHDGTVIEGWIEYYESGKQLRLRLSDSRWKFIDHADIARIVSAVPKERVVTPEKPGNIPFALRRDLDIVYLLNGEAYSGTILNYQKDSFLTLLADKKELVFADEEIDRIIYGNRRKSNAIEHTNHRKSQIAREYTFQETGFFQAATISFSIGQETADPRAFSNFFDSRSENVLAGYGFHYTAGHQFNRLLGIGLTLGLDAYNLTAKESVVSLAAQYRGYFSTTRFAPLAMLDAGYGQGIRKKSVNITEAGGGLLLHPALGFRLGGSSSHNLTLDLGIRMQQASFTREFPQTGSTQFKRTTYRRWVFRLGMIF